ncbi:MAG: TolC family protein, partial [Fusobacterium sp.]
MKSKIIFLLFVSFLNFSCSNTKSFHNQKTKKLTEVESLKKYGESISLAEALKIGEERNLTLKIKTLQREVATLNKNISFGNFLPSINLVGNYSQFNNDINIDFDISELTSSFGNSFSKTTMSSTLIEKSSYTYGVNAQIPIFVPSYWYLYSAKKNGEDMSKLVESLSKKLIELQITSQYFYILTLQSQEIYLKNEIKSIEETVKRAKISLEVESIMPWEYKKVLVLLKTKKYNLKENKRNLKIAKMNLLKSLDLNPLDNITLESYNFKQEPFPDLEECILNSLTNNETLKISNLNVDISQNAKKIAISNFLPKIILGGGYVNNSNQILSDPSFLNANVSGVISLFNGFKNINEYKKAIRKEKIANLNLEKE